MDLVLLKQIIRDEGRCSTAYKDSKGLWTIGDGILVDPSVPGAGLRPEEMDFLTNNRLALETAEVANLVGDTWWRNLSPPRQRVLVNMCHNMGLPKLAGFRQMLADVRLGNYLEASGAMLASKWATEVGERATRLALQMKDGVDQ